ncbi:NAD(P)H-hydrate epimerase [Brachybacterium huguangmaarense]|uniref:Bifunctional NAD(P)H-hydrate repair enzyme n=1 Tax=Brachybacterium huguangmaarense TaxID=1652028 RepID=A0ABY6G162_9MICO|nr:NAD(P)H-hydrate epimerase [Brachybacterium huguangmaarense]UYG16940.1 NAD(P)H-hydrate epimerase [Brachybacterium huguangmaarense]
MITAYTAEDVRRAERPLLDADVPLMQRAAAALAARCLPLLRERAGTVPGSRVVLLVGPGSNGGDALFAGAHLARRGAAVTAVQTEAALHDAGAAALSRAGGCLHRARGADEQTARLLGDADLVVDGVLGIGGRPELSDELAAILAAANASPASVVAVDVPTGVDATTGEAADDAVRAELTVTMGAVKAGLLLPGAAAHVGRVDLVDLGLAPHLPSEPAVRRLETEDVRELWPVPGPADQKYSRGVVTIDAGSADFPGAGVLSASGAARAGAGMVRYRGPAAVRDMILARRPEVVGADGRHQAVVIGSGLSPEDPRCRRGVEELCAEDAVGVLDAGALSAIRPGDRLPSHVVLTPHAGEAARLAEALDLPSSLPPARLAGELARATGATVLLKGEVTLVADGDAPDRLYSQAEATPWLGTAGTGDVLGGILGTLLAAGLPGPLAAALAASVHGRAGVAASRGGTAPLVALDVAEHVPAVLTAILGGAITTVASRGGA